MALSVLVISAVSIFTVTYYVSKGFNEEADREIGILAGFVQSQFGDMKDQVLSGATQANLFKGSNMASSLYGGWETGDRNIKYPRLPSSVSGHYL